MANLFNSIRVKKPKRSLFNLSHQVLLTTNIGTLTPILCQDIVPGDTWKMSSEVFLRFAPLAAPIMQQCDVFVHFFFVPYRLVWEKWEDFITAGEDGKQEPELPYFGLKDLDLANDVKSGTMLDYMGIPIPTDQISQIDADAEINALPFRAYQLIYNEYYRDQNLTDEVEVNKSSGHVSSDELQSLLTLRYRAWEKDMFTSALPNPQRGEDVLIPFTEGLVDIEFDRDKALDSGKYTNFTIAEPNESMANGDTQIYGRRTPSVTGNDGYLLLKRSDAEMRPGLIDNSSSLVGKLRTLNATLTDFRTAMKVQELLELSARVGSRYVEQLLGFFGVKSSDARLQRPEYLGGGRAPIIISDVMQQSQTTDDSVLGEFAGKGVALARANTFKRYFEEHGVLLGILSVRPRSTYMNGLPRYFSKSKRFDFYFPQFAHLGEQAILKKEVNLGWENVTSEWNDKEFGYTPRYAEYKYIPGSIHGDFRNSLLPWHLGRNFQATSEPNLNTRFVEVRPNENDRIFAVTADEKVPYNQKVWIQVYNKIKAKRPMPKFGTPHF